MGVCELGLSCGDAWRLTLSEINHLVNYTEKREYILNYRAAMIVAAIYNVNRDVKKKKEPYTPAEILGEPKQKPVDMIETAKTLTEFYGGEVRTG